MKRGAIFDMDGTLFDTEALYMQAWVEVADEFGLERKPEIAVATVGVGVEEAAVMAEEYYPGINGMDYVYRVIAYVERKMAEHVPTMKGVADILAFFDQQGIPMAVASSSPANLIEENLKKAGFLHYFRAFVGGDQIKNGKPAPDIYQKAASLLGLPPEDCYAFEDSPNGIRAGAAAGCTTVMIPDQIQPTEEMKKLSAAICGSLTEAMEAIKKGDL